MIVSQLIAKLQALPQHLPVEVYVLETGRQCIIDGIELYSEEDDEHLYPCVIINLD